MDKPLPNWIDCELDGRFDIAALRPPKSPKGVRFETEVDVRERADKHIIPGLRINMPATAERIVDCAEGNKKCLLPICPICARHYRRFFISEVLQIYTKSPNGAQTATVYLDTYKAGALSNASLRTAHDRFRKQLERSDFGGAVVIGGTEVTYRPELNDWLLHLHLLFLGASEQAWQNLEKLMANYPVHDPLRPKPINNPVDQLSYLQKFHTYYRAGTPNGKNRAQPYPLKKPHLCELASWACQHNFSDFTFCYGAQKASWPRSGERQIKKGVPSTMNISKPTCLPRLRAAYPPLVKRFLMLPALRI